MQKVPVSVLVITFNEEKNLDACLKSVAGWASEIFVLDSYSTDSTLEIAKKYGAKIYQNKFISHGAQRNWALKNIAFSHDWILALDADHQVMEELAQELAEVIPTAPSDVHGYFIKRRQVFRGSWIRFGGYYPKFMLKLFRRQTARFDETELDDRVYLDGKTANLKCDIIEDNVNESDIGFWIEKHNKYSLQTAKDELQIRRGQKQVLITPNLFGNPNERVYWLKMRWYQMPLYVRPFLYFAYRYFFKLGFLDGKQGFIFHFMQAFWFRLLVDIKLDDLMTTQSVKPKLTPNLQSPDN